MEDIEFFSIKEALEKNVEPSLELVENVLRGKNKVSLLSGSSKVGKSCLALDLAYSVANGFPFLGNKTEKKDVLYIALDNDEDLIVERIRKMGMLETTHLDFLCQGPIILGNDEKQNDNLNVSTLSEVINDSFQRLPKLGLVVIDVMQDLRNCNSYNEYSNAKMAEDINFFKGIAAQYDVHILLINHDKLQQQGYGYNASLGGTKLVGTINGSFLHLTRQGMGSGIAKLEIGGRNVRERVLALQLDFDTLTYALSEEDCLEDNLDFDIARIRNYMLKTNGYEGTLSRLCSLLELRIRSNQLSKKLKENRDLLLEEGILFEMTLSHKQGRIYTFTVQKGEKD